MFLTLCFSLLHVLQSFFIIQPIELPDVKLEHDHYKSQKQEDEQSIIVEVDGDPEENAKQIETYHHGVEVVQVYTSLFQGIAIKGSPEKIAAVHDLEFVKGVYPVQTYISLQENPTESVNTSAKTWGELKKESNMNLPATLNPTSYTGKGSKIGVIDTGIDLTHPDLKKNYRGGFDLVDLDDEPMETTEEEGMPTMHGSHVAGIIAADGALQGVAPDSELYAYRALGPGGVGSSVHVIAALEEALNDGMDIVNLSLGNTINGPDYPTSKAVNEAVEQGMAVVVANGNDGPDNWTVGAPATATAALSVGAQAPAGERPVLHESRYDKTMDLSPLPSAPSWDLKRDYPITENVKDARGKILLIEQKTKRMEEMIEEAMKAGAVALLFHQKDPSDLEWSAIINSLHLKVPAAVVSEEDGQWIKEQEGTFYETIYEETEESIADFSSRGPVTVNWMMKPDVMAPGVNIASTVPGGYELLNGTSMAAPHVAGAFAVLQEAHPEWTNQQLKGALQTTAQQLPNMSSVDQGAGLVDIQAAIDTSVIIYNPLLSFGRIREHINKRTVDVTIENVSDSKQEFRFELPKQQNGLTWQLPHAFEIEPQGKRTVPVTMKIDTARMDESIYNGHLNLSSKEETYQLPYVAVGDKSDFPQVMGFQLAKDPSGEGDYEYSLYSAEALKKITLRLYNPDTLKDEGVLLETEDIEVGMNEGKLEEKEIKQQGYYHGLITAENEQGEMKVYETEVIIE